MDFTSAVKNLPQCEAVPFHTNVWNEDNTEHVLFVLPADVNMNRRYRSGLINKTNALNKGKSGKLTEKALDTGQDATIDLYSKTVITGWEGVKDGGNEAKFTPGNCNEYLRQMKEHGLVWDDLADFCQDPANFVKADDAVDEIMPDDAAVDDAIKN